jgi:glycosyltransferase involved in cell wall biosynthesis
MELGAKTLNPRPYTGAPVPAANPSRPPEVEGLSIVLPAYNEAANVRVAVEKALTAAQGLAVLYEVIVVDDGSQDATGETVEEIARLNYPRVRLVRHKVNAGYGAALRTGFKHSRYGLVFFTDSDNQFDVSELQYFLPLMASYDMVTGFRVYRYDSVVRCMLSWIYNRLVGVMFRVRVRDVDCAFKLMTREVVQKVTIECDNFFVNTELLARARRWNFRITEKGVRHYPRTAGETSVRPSDIPRTLATVFRMWRQIYFPTRSEMDRPRADEPARPAITEFIPARD